MKREDVKELIAILMHSPFYLTLPVSERYGLVVRLIKDYPLLAGKGDTNLKGSSEQGNPPTITN